MFESGQSNALVDDVVPAVPEIEPVDSQEIDAGQETPAAAEAKDTPAEGTPPAESAQGEEDQSAEAQPESEEAEIKDQEPEVTPEIQAQIDELKKELEKANKRDGYNQRQLKKLEKQLEARQVEPEAEDAAAPQVEDFDTYEDYNAALVEYKVKKGISDYHKQVAQQTSAGNLDVFIEDTKERGRERYTDFDDVVLNETVPITQPMLQIMQECENPESIAYYLGKNIKDATAISRMSPTQAARALGIIEARVASELKAQPATPAKPVKTVSTAPPPVKPTGSANVVSKDPEKMSQSEYEAWRASGGGT